jgi:hypothetical protein
MWIIFRFGPPIAFNYGRKPRGSGNYSPPPHEDNLLNQRLSWILTSQSFLLTGYAILLNAPAALQSETYARHHRLLMELIPLSGVVTVFLIWAAIIAALLAMRDLRARTEAHPGFESSHIQGRPMTRSLGMAAPTLIPVVFLVSWLVIILH